MEIVGLLLWVVMGCAVPAGSEEVHCPVSIASTDGPGDLVPSEGSSQRGLCFADILGFLLDLEGPSQMGKLRQGAVETWPGGPQNLLLTTSPFVNLKLRAFLTISSPGGCSASILWAAHSPSRAAPASPHLDGSPDLLTCLSKHLMIFSASCNWLLRMGPRHGSVARAWHR